MQTQTRGRAPAGPLASPTATSTSTSTSSAFCATTSTSAISPLPPPARPLPSLPLPSLLPAQPQAHAQPRPSDETFTAASTRTDVRTSVQAQTQFTSDRVSGPGPSSGSVSEIACTSEEGGGKKTKKEKKEKAPKVKKTKEVQEKVKVKQPRFVSVPISRVPCPSLHFTSGGFSRFLMSVPSIRIFVSSRPVTLPFVFFLLPGFEFMRLNDSVSVDRYPSTVLSPTLTSPGYAGQSFGSPASDRVQAHAHRILHTSERPSVRASF